MKKKHAIGGLLTGVLGSGIVKGALGQAFGEIVGKAGEEFTLRIKEGGKGFMDEVLYNIVKFAANLSQTEIKDLQNFTSQLYEYDKQNHTETLKKFILFLATSANEFIEKKTTQGSGKYKRTATWKARDTETGGNFLKELLAYLTFEEKMDYCRANHVFEEPPEGYERVARKILSNVKKRAREIDTASLLTKLDSGANRLTQTLGAEILQKIPEIEDPGFFKGVFGFSPRKKKEEEQ